MSPQGDLLWSRVCFSSRIESGLSRGIMGLLRSNGDWAAHSRAAQDASAGDGASRRNMPSTTPFIQQVRIAGIHAHRDVISLYSAARLNVVEPELAAHGNRVSPRPQTRSGQTTAYASGRSDRAAVIRGYLGKI